MHRHVSIIVLSAYGVTSVGCEPELFLYAAQAPQGGGERLRMQCSSFTAASLTTQQHQFREPISSSFFGGNFITAQHTPTPTINSQVNPTTCGVIRSSHQDIEAWFKKWLVWQITRVLELHLLIATLQGYDLTV